MAAINRLFLQGVCSGNWRHHTSYERWLESLAVHCRFLASVSCHFLRDFGRQTYMLPCTHIINSDQVFGFHCWLFSRNELINLLTHYGTATQSVVHGPVLLASPGSLLEMQNLRPPLLSHILNKNLNFNGRKYLQTDQWTKD